MTKIHTQFFPNLYRDSVALMRLSALLAKLPGIEQASAQMATAANLQLMKDAGLLTELPEPRPNDILLVVQGEESALEDAAKAAAEKLNEKAGGSEETQKEPLKSIEMAFEDASEKPNLVLISTPGDYAAAEAMKALRLGMNAMLFSDNVSVEQEIALKQYAQSKNLLVMGPDCGTAIIDGIPLAFANVVGKGNIGVVGASGTGTQQVTCLIDQYGGGITHAIGTGGHDLSEAVGGITMLTALAQLTEDKATQVIVLVSKPPSAKVAQKVLEAAKKAGKPVVVCFLGADPATIEGDNLVAATTLEEAARLAIQQAKIKLPEGAAIDAKSPALQERAKKLASQLKPTQTQLRGLYSGGTFCYEALLLLQDSLPGLTSNTPTGKVTRVTDLWKSTGNNILDLGDDDFTRGRPHPMIDPTLRNERLIEEAADEKVAIILLDFVLGYGANENPAGEIVPHIQEAQAAAAKAGRKVLFIGHICGTDKDPQGMAAQRKILLDAGVELTNSNAEAAFLCQAVLEAAPKQ